MTSADLPIYQVIPDVLDILSSQQSLVLKAEPGAGKSTALPLSLLKADFLNGQKIVMLEPRRVAARSIAQFLAKQLGEKVGQRVGYQVRNERKVSSDTVLEIVTEGVLTRRLLNDPELDGVGLLIFDEFHERSLQADVGLMLAAETQQALRDDLKILVMSATIDTAMLSDYLGGAKTIDCPGRAFPVALNYLGQSRERLADQVARAVNTAIEQVHSGDVLVFLPGRKEINWCLSALERSAHLGGFELCQLHGSLPLEAQSSVLRPSDSKIRRVILSTNIAETSLTIEGVTAVVDSGLAREVVYDPNGDMARLETVPISKASATQRAGRAGRVQPGHCWRLWSEESHRQRTDFQSPEIVNADLTATLLDLLDWGWSDYNAVPWLTPPPASHYSAAQQTLKSLQFVDDHGALTPLGRESLGLGVSPRLASILLRANTKQERALACDMVALLADRGIFDGHGPVDLTVALMALADARSSTKQPHVQYRVNKNALRDCLASSSKLRRQFACEEMSLTHADIERLSGTLAFYGFSDRVAKRREEKGYRYLLANGRGVTLPEGDPLAASEYLVVLDLDGKKAEGLIFDALAIAMPDLLTVAAGQLQTTADIEVSKDQQKLYGRVTEKFGALVINANETKPIVGEALQRELPNCFAKCGLTLLHWTPQCSRWLERVMWLQQQMTDWPAIDQQWLADHVEDWLLPYASSVKQLGDLKKIQVLPLLEALLTWEQQQILAREAPDSWITPSGKSVAVDYSGQQGPIVSVQLQELFGQGESPRLGGGKIPLRFELLSPARRPIQTTSDLAGFWVGSYVEVAKEMRGRYPKHRWPEDPLQAEAGRSIKRR